MIETIQLFNGKDISDLSDYDKMDKLIDSISLNGKVYPTIESFIKVVKHDELRKILQEFLKNKVTDKTMTDEDIMEDLRVIRDNESVCDCVECREERGEPEE